MDPVTAAQLGQTRHDDLLREAELRRRLRIARGRRPRRPLLRRLAQGLLR